MKAKLFGLLMCMGLMLGFATAQVTDQQEEAAVTATFKLEGDEGQCGPFEEAIAEGGGIVSTDYSWLNKELDVTYNPNEISLDEVKNKLSEKGYVPAAEAEQRAEGEQEEEAKEIALQCKFEERPEHEDQDMMDENR